MVKTGYIEQVQGVASSVHSLNGTLFLTNASCAASRLNDRNVTTAQVVTRCQIIRENQNQLRITSVVRAWLVSESFSSQREPMQASTVRVSMV